jgi:PadR family transcriptional regulator PadR
MKSELLDIFVNLFVIARVFIYVSIFQTNIWSEKMILLSRSEEIVLLAVWKLKDNAYGVTIREQVSKDTGHEWSFGAVYKPLKKLLHRDFLEKTSSQPCSERGGRSKYLYTLTPDGREALREIRKIYKTIWTEDSKIAFD